MRERKYWTWSILFYLGVGEGEEKETKQHWETIVKLLAKEQNWLIKKLRPNYNTIEYFPSFQTSLSPYHLYTNILPETEY